MVISGLLEGHHQLSMKVVLNSVMAKSGAQSVMTFGEIQMLQLFADNLATLILVSLPISLFLSSIILTNSMYFQEPREFYLLRMVRAQVLSG